MKNQINTKDQTTNELGLSANHDFNESTKWTKSTCPYCGIGCGMIVGVEKSRIVQVRGLKEHPTNKGNICHLAKNLPYVFDVPGRLTHHMIKRNGKLESVTLDESISHISTKFRETIKKYGPDAVAFYGGASSTCEEYYLINKLMKGFLGTNNLDASARLCMASTAAGFVSTIGIDAPFTCYADIEEADLFFIAGNNMAVSLPILFDRIKAAKKKRGTNVIVVDPRRTETAKIADMHLQIWPGTDVALNNALAYVLFEEGFVSETNVNYNASGLVELKEFIKNYPPSRVAKITGCSEDQIKNAARMVGESKAMLTFWFQGYNHSTQAVFKNNTLHNLLLLTDNFCRPGTGPLSITGEANTLGCRWIGALAHLLPGSRQITNIQHCKEISDYWGVPVENIKAIPGRSIIEIIKGLHSRDIRCLWVMATNPAASLPNTQWIEEGLAKADMLVVQDIFHPTETTMLADVVLAGAQWGEKTGTFISSERRMELVEKVVEPPGDAKPDYEIIWLIARAMGFNKEFSYNSPELVFEELKGITHNRICDMNGIFYERLRGKVGPQLPCPEPLHPGTPRLFLNHEFPRTDGRAALLSRDYSEPAETTDNEYPFVLITGRLSSHFNTRTRTARIPKLNAIEPENFIEIHPDDAANLRISADDRVEVKSRRGSVHGKARLTDRMLTGTIYMNSHYGKAICAGNGNLANLVTNPAYDMHSKQPEFKFSAVNILKI